MKKGTKFNAYVVQPKKLAHQSPFVFEKENLATVFADDSAGNKRILSKAAFTFEELNNGKEERS